MKLTKTYLKKLIKEELESTSNTHNFRFYYYSDRYKGFGDAGTAFFLVNVPEGETETKDGKVMPSEEALEALYRISEEEPEKIDYHHITHGIEHLGNKEPEIPEIIDYVRLK